MFILVRYLVKHPNLFIIHKSKIMDRRSFLKNEAKGTLGATAFNIPKAENFTKQNDLLGEMAVADFPNFKFSI